MSTRIGVHSLVWRWWCAVDKHKIQPPLEDHLQAPYITTDPSVSASYIALTDNQIARTDEVHSSVLLDLDESGQVVGIEIFGDEFIKLIQGVAGEHGEPHGWLDISGRASEAY